MVASECNAKRKNLFGVHNGKGHTVLASLVIVLEHCSSTVEHSTCDGVVHIGARQARDWHNPNFVYKIVRGRGGEGGGGVSVECSIVAEHVSSCTDTQV